MTLSVWRYAHLAFAVCSFLFLALASITGAILAFDAVKENTTSYRIQSLDKINLATSLPALRKLYPEISEISVDNSHRVILKGLDREGNDIEAYINPQTGAILGVPPKKSEFIEWITALHRSLFLHEAGRFFVGLSAFLLLLITISGTILIIQRQQGIPRFFAKVIKDNFSQYYHVVTGRLLLIPVFILALTGTYLSLERFHLFPEKKITHSINSPDSETPQKAGNIANFQVFKQTYFHQIQKIEFPFAEEPEEYYTLKLNDRELVVNQFSGAVLSEVKYPFQTILVNLSLDLHTGRASLIWAVVLGLASVNILFFIYSGFSMTLSRRATRIKNKFKASESKIILLVGSENGSTLTFANAIHQQLLAQKQICFLAELNNYTTFPQAEHIIIFTATHGLGDAPFNANKVESLINQYAQEQTINVSVIGFGSKAYPDFCGYAKSVEAMLAQQSWVHFILPLFTVDDKSSEQFVAWVKAWSEKTAISLSLTPALYSQKPAGLRKVKVLDKVLSSTDDETFILTLQPNFMSRFTSGDLLAVYPAGDGRERLYSISKSKKRIQLAVKLHPYGLGSNYLHNLASGSVIKTRIISNPCFHFPRRASKVVMIANGTGIAPFLGMLENNKNKTEVHLYCGFRKETDLTLHYQSFAETQIARHFLKSFHIAFSREQNQCYVMDLIDRDADFFSDLLKKGGVVMLCGSLAMQNDVENTLEKICLTKTDKNLAYYKANGQILTDCY
jgi:sulfite reductase (NADPH) flavoprotein alpha-component